MIQKNTGSQFVLGFQYFIYFGVMGIFLPYFNLYCYHLGFSGFEIGLLSAVRTLVIVAFSFVWGVVSDQFSIRKPIYILCNVLSAALWALFMFTTDFKAMLAITIAYAIFYGPIIAFLETFTMELLGKDGNNKKKYGNIRVWGSLNFIMVVVILGKLTDSLHVEIIIPLILAGSLIQAFFSLWVPAGTRTGVGSFFKNIGNLLNIRMGVFLISSFLMLASHGTYYGFFSIHLEKLGYDNTFIGLAWGLASISEIFIMLRSDVIFNRFSIKNVLVFSFCVAVIRWFILFAAVSPTMILFAQVLHAVTYGTFHIACILYMDELTTKETKTFGQVTNNAVSYGLGMMTGFVINGIYFEKFGALLFAMSAIMALAGGALVMSTPKARGD